MSDLAIGRGAQTGGAFNLITVAVMLVVGIVGFAGTLVLGAYAPDLKTGRNGGAHALSNAAVGFSGLVRLAQATGRNPTVVRNDHALDEEQLLIATPEHGSVPMDPLLTKRGARTTLVVLPKWETAPDPDRSGWVRMKRLLDATDPQRVLAPDEKYEVHRAPSGGRPLVTVGDVPREIRFHAPRPLQTITGAGLKPLVTDGKGGIVLAQVGDKPLYILADPDLIDNAGLKDVSQAASALALLDWMNENGAEGISFDVTLNGFGRSRNLLKLAFEPPALAMTLTILVAAVLVVIHALGRFGAPRERERAIEFGKRALVDNAAAMVRMARRESALGPRYVHAMRERAQRAFGLSPQLKDDALDAALDRLGKGARFTTLADALHRATDRASLLAAAEALHDWQEGTRR